MRIFDQLFIILFLLLHLVGGLINPSITANSLKYQYNRLNEYNNINININIYHHRISRRIQMTSCINNNNKANVINKTNYNTNRQTKTNINFKQIIKLAFSTLLLSSVLISGSMGGLSKVIADDELAAYAAQGNEVGVDGQCFMKKCALETSRCANNPNCLKGLSCLARCKGGSLCSTGCFAKFGMYISNVYVLYNIVYTYVYYNYIKLCLPRHILYMNL